MRLHESLSPAGLLTTCLPHPHPPISAEFPNGKVFWAASDLPAKTSLREGPGGYVVLSGVIKRILTLPDGTKKVLARG